MGSDRTSVRLTDDANGVERLDETRRSLLAKAGAVAGGVGLLGLANGQSAYAHHTPPAPEDFDGYYNIKHFGASTSNAPAVNQTAIQACIDQAALDGKAVYIPPGVFETFGALGVPDNSIIRGVGPASVIKDTATTQSAIRGAAAGAAKNVVIEHIKVDRTLGNHPPSARCFWFSNGTVERIFIRHVECVGAPESGMGIEVDGVSCAVHDCYVHECGKDGIACYGGPNNVVADNVIVACGDDHVAVGGSRITVVGNICDAGAGPTADPMQLGSGIALRGGDRCTIVGNVVRGGYRAGIEFQGAGAVEDVVISGNTIVEAGNGGRFESTAGSGAGTGILVRAPTTTPIERVSITGNVIRAPRYHGIWIRSHASGGFIKDLRISDNHISFDPGASYRLPDSSGIACIDPVSDVTDVRISGNVVRRAGGAGIYVKGLAAGVPRRFDISGNNVVDSGSDSPTAGILLHAVNDISVMGNRAYDSGVGTQDAGMSMVSPKGHVIIVGNDFTGNLAPLSYSAGSPGPDRLRIRDNPGFSPWTGRVTIDGAWAGVNPFTKESSTITFGVPFPTGKPPRVHVTGESVDAAGVSTAVSEAGFKARLVASANLGSGSHRAVWTAEPDDDSNGD